MLRPKNCKKCGGKMQMGGATSMVLPSVNQPVYQTQEEVDAANALAKRLAVQNRMLTGENTYVASKPGDPVARFFDTSGRDITGLPSPLSRKAMSIPSNIGWNDIQSSQGLFWYNDPQTGDPIDIDASVLNTPRLLRERDALTPPSVALRMKGGKIIRQTGGVTPPIPNVDLSMFMPNPVDQSLSTPYSNPQYTDSVQEGIAKGIISVPENWIGNPVDYEDPQTRNNMVPQNTLQNLGITLQGLRTGLGEIAGRVERGRQNQYDYQQQTALGQMNPMPSTDYQPNPYSLYAKYGGSLKKHMKYGGLQHVNYFGPPFSNGAKMNMGDNEKYDKVVVTRKIVPEMFNLYRTGKKSLIYQKGGIHIKPENKGKFTDYCGGKVTDECIQKGLNSPSAVIRKRANFARNARSWN